MEASRLRSKLSGILLATVAPPLPLRIELPKGSYVPVFSARQTPEDVPAVQSLAAPSVELPVPTPVNHRYLPPGVAVCMLLLVGIAAVYAFPKASSTAEKFDDPIVVEQYLRADKLFRQSALTDGWAGTVPPHVTDAIAQLESITKRAPRFTRAWVSLAEAHEWAYELDKEHPRSRLMTAVSALETALKIDPDLADAHSRLGSIYFHGFADLKRAETAVRRAIELNSRDARSQARYVDLLRIEGRVSEAMVQVNRALSIEPTSGRLWAQQALLLYDLSRYEEAIAAADHALMANAGNQMNQIALPQWVRGLSFERLGRIREAEEAFRKGLEVSPQDDWNRRAGSPACTPPEGTRRRRNAVILRET